MGEPCASRFLPDVRQVRVISGVPKGTVLGPLLFLILINDLPNCVDSKTRLIADDCVVVWNALSFQDCQELQHDLDKLAQWEQIWIMSYNPDKCSVLRVLHENKPVTYNYSLKGKTRSSQYNSVPRRELSSNMTWNSHIDHTIKNANNILGFLHRNLGINNSDTKKASYRNIVRSNLGYCASTLSPYTATCRKHKSWK